MTGLCAFARHGLTLLILSSAVGAPLPAQRVETPFLDSVLVRLAGSGDRFPVSTDICRGHARVVDQICQGLIRSRTGGWYLVPDGRTSEPIHGQELLRDGVTAVELGLQEDVGIPPPWIAGEIRNGVERLRRLAREAPEVAHVWYGLALAVHHVEHRPDSALVLLDRAAQVGGVASGLLALARARALLHLGQHHAGMALLVAASVDTTWVTREVLGSLYWRTIPPEGRVGSATSPPLDTSTMVRVVAQRLTMPPLTRPLVMRSRFYRLDTALGATVVVPAAIYRQTLRPSDTLPDGRLHVTVRVRLAAVRVSDGLTVVVDTLRQFALPPTTLAVSLDRSWLQLTTEIALPPGRFGVTWAVVQPDGGGLAQTLPPIDVPLPTSGLRVSSLIAGSAERGIPWPFGPETIGLNPVAEWRRGEQVPLAAIISGLAAGEHYRSTLRLFPMQGPDVTTPSITLATNEVATGPLTRWFRVLQPGAVPQGSYCIELTITREADSVATSDAIEVDSWTTRWVDWLSNGSLFPLPQQCVGVEPHRMRSWSGIRGRTPLEAPGLKSDTDP